MTTTTQTRTPARAPRLPRDEAMQRAAAEYDRMLDLLRSLSPEEWATPTDCPGWDVRTMASHVLASAQAHASIPELVHQYRGARRTGPNFVDGMTAVQVRDRASSTPAEIVAQLTAAAPASVKARRRMPAVIRSRTMYVDLVDERWTLAFLLDVIFTRDSWMHRVDITRATGREMVLTPEHDGRIVADAVAEWAGRHGRPFRLVLDGPAGGEFAAGVGGEPIELDAVEFCRVLAGRAAGQGLLTQEVPF
jgi:uncharacterized protein (TIGR03083 family)